MLADQDVFQDAQVVEEAQVLEGARDAELGDAMRRQTGDVDAVVHRVPLSGRTNPVNMLNSVVLPGAVGADHADDFARVDHQVDVVGRQQTAEALDQSL